MPYKTIIAEYNSEQTEKENRENRVEINNGSKQNKGRKSLVGQKLPFDPYILSNTKQYFDEGISYQSCPGLFRYPQIRDICGHAKFFCTRPDFKNRARPETQKCRDPEALGQFCIILYSQLRHWCNFSNS